MRNRQKTEFFLIKLYYTKTTTIKIFIMVRKHAREWEKSKHVSVNSLPCIHMLIHVSKIASINFQCNRNLSQNSVIVTQDRYAAMQHKEHTLYLIIHLFIFVALFVICLLFFSVRSLRMFYLLLNFFNLASVLLLRTPF